MNRELEVLIEQLDELLASPIVDEDDALEVAMVAGLASRLSAPADAMAAAIAWRDGVGRELLDETWAAVDTEELLDTLDGVSTGGASDEEIEEAVYDFDDLVAAAIWCGRAGAVRVAARRAAESIRMVPDPFADLADVGAEFARLPTVAEHLDLYDYWLAIADSRSAIEE